jgi:hypothetical protein
MQLEGEEVLSEEELDRVLEGPLNGMIACDRAIALSVVDTERRVRAEYRNSGRRVDVFMPSIVRVGGVQVVR